MKSICIVPYHCRAISQHTHPLVRRIIVFRHKRNGRKRSAFRIGRIFAAHFAAFTATTRQLYRRVSARSVYAPGQASIFEPTFAEQTSRVKRITSSTAAAPPHYLSNPKPVPADATPHLNPTPPTRNHAGIAKRKTSKMAEFVRAQIFGTTFEITSRYGTEKTPRYRSAGRDIHS